ncbi:hypothetical protein ES332_A08G039200v1 [Gossypium tomentosum]|uniref:Uncharacterized protein n=1 Tax=Gossypium tomentosum TaxID=34277 RepID=A0A5D2PB64_GOSTO|nr:hypothetical protein ES332_A08G039200v1 [Gossypium tomentosum]
MASFGMYKRDCSLKIREYLQSLRFKSCVSNSEACTRDIDCLGQCKHGGFCDLITKKCSFLPVSEQVPSNIAATVDAMQ